MVSPEYSIQGNVEYDLPIKLGSKSYQTLHIYILWVYYGDEDL
jgi:hypothetical protein